MPSSKALPSFRRKAAQFRLAKDRDDHAFNVDMVRVFVHTALSNPLLRHHDVGIYAAPCVVLQGYAIARTDSHLLSVQADPTQHTVGRMVELHPTELARLDDVAEHAGDYHRFLAEVVGPSTGMKFSVWVYQHRSHATRVELATSASELPAPASSLVKALK